MSVSLAPWCLGITSLVELVGSALKMEVNAVGEVYRVAL